MLTFKLYNILMLSLGGMGVWLICRRYIGEWVGVVGSFAYIAQPFILLTLLDQGQVAQGPIIALNPWYLLILLELIRDMSRSKFILATILCSVMILSHPNSIFMAALCVAITLVGLLFYGETKLHIVIIVGLSIMFAGLLTAFWSLVGVTGLENPTIPFLLGEAVKLHSATFEWFTSPLHYFYFALSGQAASVISILTILIRKKSNSERSFNHNALTFLSFLYIISIIFSFGLALPFFKYIPLAQSMVAGRILALTSIPSAFFCAYLVHIARNIRINNAVFGFSVRMTIPAITIALLIIDMNPLKYHYFTREFESSQQLYGLNSEKSFFERGRFAFMGTYDSSISFFPILLGFNLSEGFNIEGTPHNKAIWNSGIAAMSDCSDWIAKNMAFWNVRYLRLSEELWQVANPLCEQYRFAPEGDENAKIEEVENFSGYFYSSEPPTYCLMDSRNALIFGHGSLGIATEFPYLVHDDRNNLYEFTEEELSRYKLIYICEPEIPNIEEKEKLEVGIQKLIEKGVHVLVEPSILQRSDLFGVRPIYYNSGTRVGLQRASWNEYSEIEIPSGLSFLDGAIFSGLDKSNFQLDQKEMIIDNTVIGTKAVGTGDIIFIGMNFSHSLKAVHMRNWGKEKTESETGIDWTATKAFYDDMFGHFGVEKNFWPDAFPVGPIDWDYKGLSFTYDSDQEKEVTISVTYSPRWKVTVDGQEVPYGQKEHLIVLTLPTGEHRVELLYGITIYGIAGYVISIISTIIFLFFLVYYDIIFQWIKGVVNRTKDVLEIAP